MINVCRHTSLLYTVNITENVYRTISSKEYEILNQNQIIYCKFYISIKARTIFAEVTTESSYLAIDSNSLFSNIFIVFWTKRKVFNVRYLFKGLSLLVDSRHSYFDRKSNKARTGHIMATQPSYWLLMLNIKKKRFIYIPFIKHVSINEKKHV